ncbi:MAG: Hsp20/alpha crystallin family protein [Methanobacteriaceae archaeon]|nr:Hsp20/alpha crystallin family protein [Methanobacteriaceae archaeon]MDP3484394.1 Hsp20/alpha crystallin family protein [Methanobacteriaceae archaeon]MDP3624503.1 Hsp20/alpha crystallin family protein [Methanobacteriaceae archaeon]
MEKKETNINENIEEEIKEENTDNKSEDKEKINAEKLLNDIISDIQNKAGEFGKTISDYKTALQKPLTDVIETENSLIVKFDLPGVNKDDIDLEISEDSIKIKVLFEEKNENIKYLQKERSHGKLLRSLTLPMNIKTEEVKATFKDSILTVEMPKMDKEVHKVDII